MTLADVYEFRSGLSKAASDFGSGYPFLTLRAPVGYLAITGVPTAIN